MNPTVSCFEIVHFAFQAAVPLPKQLQCMRTIGDWAQRQPGFLARQSYHDPQSNRWTDVVEWRHMTDAQAAMERIRQEASLADVMTLIVPDSLYVGHHERLI